MQRSACSRLSTFSASSLRFQGARRLVTLSRVCWRQPMDVDFHDVHHIQKLGFVPDEVVQSQREPFLLQLYAPVDQEAADLHGFENLEHDLAPRQQLDNVAHQQAGAEIDVAGVLAQHRLHAELGEGVVDHGGAGEDIVLKRSAIEASGAEQQLEGRQILLAIEDRLTPEEQLLGRSTVHSEG